MARSLEKYVQKYNHAQYVSITLEYISLNKECGEFIFQSQVTELHFDFPYYLCFFTPIYFLYRTLVTKRTLISDILFIIAIITLSTNTCHFYLCVCRDDSELVSQSHISRKHTHTDRTADFAVTFDIYGCCYFLLQL